MQQVVSQTLKTHRPKKIPPELIQGFIDGEKNPVSALMEYSAMSRLATTFQECAPVNPSLGMRWVHHLTSADVCINLCRGAYLYNQYYILMFLYLL